MTDKEKIREEVERLQKELIQEKKKGFGSDADDACILELQNVLTYIASLQEEPATSVWHDKSEKPKMNSIIVMNNNQTTLSVEYVGQSLCGVERWAYIDNLLKL